MTATVGWSDRKDANKWNRVSRFEESLTGFETRKLFLDAVLRDVDYAFSDLLHQSITHTNLLFR